MRVIESYSPKLGRRMQCFGEPVFRQWIRLEADPTVQAFCEHPTGSMSPCSSHRTDAESFTRAVEIVLKESELQDEAQYRPSAQLWAQAVRASGYVQARVATTRGLSELSKAA